MTTLRHDHVIDACHHPCPMPILMLKRALKTLAPEQVILLQSTDPHSQQDLTHFCQVQGLEVLQQQVENGVFSYYIRS